MKKYFKYLIYVLRHKWYVFIECCKVGIIWSGLTHDLSKFLPDEFIPYAKHFYGNNSGISRNRDKTGYYKPTDTGDLAFDFAWLLHQKRNKHHWQWWTLPKDGGGIKVLDMPLKYRKEMLCDWRGAGRAQGHHGDIKEWYQKNIRKMKLHIDTKDWIEREVYREGDRL